MSPRIPLRNLAAVVLALLLVPLGLVALGGPAQAAPVAVSYTGPDLPITDMTTTTAQVTASGFTGTLSKVTVSLDDGAPGSCGIIHTWDADLVISLVSPAGTTVSLSNRNGYYGDNYCGTVFDDAATGSIVGGSAPFTGTFQPQSPLSSLVGEDPNGTWTLVVSDVAWADVGTLQGFTLNLDAAPTAAAPTIHVSANQTATVGSPFSFTPTITGVPAPTITLVDNDTTVPLPAGLSLNSATGEVSGTPAVGSGGQYRIRLKATNASGTAADGFYIVVDEAAGLTGPATAAGTVGDAFSYTPTSLTGYPAPTVSATGLPPGLSVDGGTGVISGTPTTAGTFDTTLTASNGIGSPATLAVSITIELPDVTGLAPSITGRAQVGQTLVAHPGPVDPADSTLAYQWTSDGTDIAGATGPTLTLAPGVAGTHLRVRITASHAGYNPQTETSPATDYVREYHAQRTFSVDDATPSPGETVHLLGQGLVPGNTYKVTAFGATRSTVADQYGEIHAAITVPLSHRWGPAWVVITGTNPRSFDTVVLNVR